MVDCGAFGLLRYKAGLFIGKGLCIKVCSIVGRIGCDPLIVQKSC